MPKATIGFARTFSRASIQMGKRARKIGDLLFNSTVSGAAESGLNVAIVLNSPDIGDALAFAMRFARPKGRARPSIDEASSPWETSQSTRLAESMAVLGSCI